MKELYIKYIAGTLSLKDWQIENCANLFEEGCTIPFISRYRKEKTGEMDDEAVASVKHYVDVFAEMEKRKATMLETIEGLGKLTPSLRSSIENCVNSTELEDLYLPYRPKRRTRATLAKEAGLEPLADMMWNLRTAHPAVDARRYICEKAPTVEDALAGARDIIAERLSDTASVREALRTIFRTRRIVSKSTKAASENAEASKYRSYFAFSMPIARIPAHNLLAILRAEKEGFLSVSIDADVERCTKKMYYDFCTERSYPQQELSDQIKAAMEDSYKRLLEPSITTEVIREAKEKADKESIAIFGGNLRQLLLSPPVGQKRTLAIDPGFRNGCKTVCLDENGNLLHHEIIFPHPPQSERVKALAAVQQMLEKYDIQAIAIGNGTASRETGDFVRKLRLPEGCSVWTVSEDGASIYSASEVARKEFPDEDVTVRGAVSIGRRLMDPLSELVKIDPKNLGIGQYQHDVDQAMLRETLDNTVESCVNSVGVDLNVASPYLLSYVSGIGPSLSEAIVAYRTAEGSFASRAELRKVPRLGAKAFQQCAGFLRIPGASNPLDNSAVHPEAYALVDRMAASLGVPTRELVGNAELCAKLSPEAFVDSQFGLPTVRDILRELVKPGRDPRSTASVFEFSHDVHEIGDLVVGMELPGIVTNITAFGAFVDVGLHENGLIHVSQMGIRGLADPSKVLWLHQQIRVSVVSVDLERRRIGLRLLNNAS